MITQRELSRDGVGGEAAASRSGAVIDALKGLAMDPVFWIIAAITLGHTFTHYATYIPSFRRVFWGLPYFNLHILHELEYLLIITIAAYRYRWKGGALLILATLIASIPFMLTPYVFGYDPKPGELRDRGIEVGATLVIGVILTLLVNDVVRKKDRLIAAVEVLQATQKHFIESEETLRESEELHRAVVENMAEAVAITSDAKRVFVNKAFLDIHGLQDASTVIGKSMDRLIFPADREMVVERSLARQRGEPAPSSNEYRVLRPDGELRTVQTFATSLKYKGQPATLAVFRDVTDERRAEEERAQHARELERSFHALRDTQQQLIQSAKLAAIGELVSGVAHELNNPLTGVWGTSQLMMMREVDETLRGDLEVIHQESSRAVKIVQNLLSFARAHKPEKRCASVNDALEKALELRAYEMRVSGIELETELQHDLPETWFDFNQMQQVFLNVMVNAEQAMTEAHGRGRLSVRTQRVDGSILISFADDGPGIRKENLDRIFDPFFTTKGVGKGTGLGLSICYGIVQGHGGGLRVESEVGKGSTFTIEIPLTTEENQGVPA